MSIYPISVERLPIFVLLGHSNGDGWAPSSPIRQADDSMRAATADPRSFPALDYYKNFYVYTTEHPWAGDLGTPVSVSVGTGAWLEMTLAVPLSPNGPHPHGSPYAYPNNAGACYPHWGYGAYGGIAPILSGDTSSLNGARHGMELPFQWLWKNHHQTQSGMVKIAFGSSLFLPAESGTDAGPWINLNGATPAASNWIPGSIDTVNQQFDFIGWWTPADRFDFAPATDRFYKSWFDKMTGAQTALGSDTRMDVRLLVIWMGDNDALARTVEALGSFEVAARQLIRQMRNACVDNDWTTHTVDSLPVVWIGVHPAYFNGSELPDRTDEIINDALARMAKDDVMLRIVPSEDWSLMSDEGQLSIIDTFNHFGSQGYIQAANDIYDAFLEMEGQPFDAIAEEDRVAYSEFKDRVKTYYNRARVSTDVDNATLLIHANGALNSLLNAIGDNAYWLRNRRAMALSAVGQVTTLGKYVSRVLKIEHPTNAEESVPFTQVGYGSGGRLQIQLDANRRASNSTSTSSYVVHYITRPRDLTRDEQLIPLPRQYMEWMVVETCRRLARSSSNVALQASMEGEAATLRDRCLKEMLVVQRTKRERFAAIRKLPGSIRYRR